MRVCKLDEAGLIFGQGSPSMMGGFGDMVAAAASPPSTTGTQPAASAPTFTISPDATLPSNPNTGYTGPTYNGQPVTPGYVSPTQTVGMNPIGSTGIVTGNPTPDYFDNGVMCIDPASVNVGSYGPSAEAGGTGEGSFGNDAYGGADTSNWA